jgi:alpha-glucosidase
VIRFWLSRGVDGFRIDVIDRILKDEQFRDNPPNPDWKEGDPSAWSLMRKYSEQQPGTHDYMRKFRKVFDEFPERVAIGEVAYMPVGDLVAYYGAGAVDDMGDELHLPFDFSLINLPWNAAAVRAHVDEYDAALSAYAWPNYVLGNHDVPRFASRIGQGQARVAAMLLLTLRGTPTLYYGDELGMVNTPIPEDQIKDPQGKNKAGFNRDECRTPMQWDSTPNGGFSAEGALPWLPLAPDYRSVNVASQRDNPGSMLSLYRRLLAFRRNNAAMHSGRYYPVKDAAEGCFVYLRQYNDQKFLVALNFTGAPITLHLPDDFGLGTIAVSTHVEREGDMVELPELALLADEGVIIEF